MNVRLRLKLETLPAPVCGLLALVALLGGCASSAGIHSQAVAIAPAQAGLAADASAAVTPAIETRWWLAFGDPALNALIERALAGQPGLKVAQARLARADAAAAGLQALSGPQVTGALDLTRQRFSANSFYPPPLAGSVQNSGTLQVNGSWEIDFFGRNAAAIEAALGSSRAAQADLAAARVLLASQVARGYVQLGRLFAQRELAVRTLQQRTDTLALIRQRVEGGLDTTVELRQGEAALPDTRLQIEQIDEQITLARHALAALSAMAPDALDMLSVKLPAAQVLALPAQLPADLLGRRADIAAARWRVEAAGSDMRSAQAQFYPNINLVAFVGLSTLGLDRLLRADSQQYGAGPALRLPIFDSGRLRANLSGKAAELDAAVESYNGAVFDAAHDAADQVASLRSIARQQAEQARALAAAEAAHDVSTQRFRAGLSTYLVVLNTEAAVLAQRRLATDLGARALDTQIALIRALGGGYVAEPGPGSLAALATGTETKP